MILDRRGQDYPAQSITLAPFPDDFAGIFPRHPGHIEDVWPPHQLTYLGVYLRRLGCRALLIEGHYIDRDYIDDFALLYARSLRGYPNYCQRLHYFTQPLSEADWRGLVLARGENHLAAQAKLQDSYLGFTVVRPLSGTPVGRTVLRTYERQADNGRVRVFGAVRRYPVHLASFELHVEGLAFQQQDRGVSACATTALWSAMQRVAPMEGLALATPAAITQAASRYLLPDGRALPSEGLTIDQMCEAIRAAGLSPIVVRGLNLEDCRGQLAGYLASGFAPILGIRPLKHGDGHAVCVVGVKLTEPQPRSDPNLHYRDGASAIESIYLHDDRLGPYASAELYNQTVKTPDGTSSIRPALVIRWPDWTEAEHSLLDAIVIPVPVKLRLPMTRIRVLGVGLAQGVGRLLPAAPGGVVLDCRYRLAGEYRTAVAGFGLSDEGLYELSCSTALSRYIGMIELHTEAGPLFDVLLDGTETSANPAVLACVLRQRLPPDQEQQLEFVASRFALRLIR